jgi:hypothetical protein
LHFSQEGFQTELQFQSKYTSATMARRSTSPRQRRSPSTSTRTPSPPDIERSASSRKSNRHRVVRLKSSDDLILGVIREKVTLIFFNFRGTSVPFKQKTPEWFGLSSWFYMFVAVHPHLYFKIMMFFQSLASYMSDHVTHGKKSVEEIYDGFKQNLRRF